MPSYQIEHHRLRESVEIPDSVWEPIVEVDEIVLDSSCQGFPGVPTAADMFDLLGKSAAGAGPIRAAVGKPYQIDIGSGGFANWQNQGVTTEFGCSVVRSVKVRDHPDKNWCYIARIEYSNMGRIQQLGFSPPIYIGAVPIRVHFTNPLTTKTIYRSGATYPNGSSEKNSSGTGFDRSVWDATGAEVGGDSIDIAGQPVPFPIKTTRVTVEVIHRHPYLDWNDVWVGPDGDHVHYCPSTIQAFVGARNLDEFMGWDIGTVRCDAINVLPLHHEFKLYQYVFTYSEDKHSTQFTPAILQGTTRLEDSTGSSVRGLQAFEVYANQPYLNGFTWSSSDWPPDEWQYLDTFRCD